MNHIEPSIELEDKTKSCINILRNDKLYGPSQGSIHLAYKHLVHLLMDEHSYEVVYALFLSNEGTLIDIKMFDYGDVNYTPFDTQEIIEYCLENSHNKIIIAHNHPSQNPEFSENDYKGADHLLTEFSRYRINLYDFIVVTKDIINSIKFGFLDVQRKEF